MFHEFRDLISTLKTSDHHFARLFDAHNDIDQKITNMEKRIPLGLDLKGGTHLVMQVNVNDAINSEADLTMERLKQSLTSRQITYATMTRIDATNLLEIGRAHV